MTSNLSSRKSATVVDKAPPFPATFALNVPPGTGKLVQQLSRFAPQNSGVGWQLGAASCEPIALTGATAGPRGAA
ncbi:MAG TPA: hypothetical protein VGF80_14770, partial [Galbitalea sp.]